MVDDPKPKKPHHEHLSVVLERVKDPNAPKHKHGLFSFLKAKHEGDRDFTTNPEARQHAREDWNALHDEIKELMKDVSVAIHDQAPGQQRVHLLNANRSNDMKSLVGTGGGGLAMVALASAGPIGWGTTGAVMLGSMVFGGINNGTHGDDVRNIKRDYKGAVETEYTIKLGDGTTLHLPVTHDNMVALTNAVKESRKTIQPRDHVDCTPDQIVMSVRDALVDYLQKHAKGVDIRPDGQAPAKTPISGGMEVNDHSGPGNSTNAKPKGPTTLTP